MPLGAFRLNTIALPSGPADSAWIAALTNQSPNALAVATDSTGNIYAGGSATVTNPVGFVVKLPSDAASITWQRFTRLSSNANCSVRGIAIDSSSNVWAIGRTTNAGGGFNIATISKWNSSGTYQSIDQFVTTLSGSTNMFGSDIAIDTGGNLITQSLGYPTGTATYGLITHKWTSGVSFTWGASNLTTANINTVRLALDSSNNSYAIGTCSTTGQTAGGNDFFINKFNSSGTSQWQITIGDANSQTGSGIAIGSDGSIYITGLHVASSGRTLLYVAKLNSAGTSITWQRTIDQGTNNFQTTAYPSIALDSSDNVYVTGSVSISGTISGCIFKYNSSGALQWQRSFATGGTGYFTSIKITSNNLSMVLSGYAGSASQIVKLPVDGTLTGTYGSYTYSSISLTGASPTLSITSRSTTVGSPNIVNTTETSANGSTAFTRTKTTIV